MGNKHLQWFVKAILSGEKMLTWDICLERNGLIKTSLLDNFWLRAKALKKILFKWKRQPCLFDFCKMMSLMPKCLFVSVMFAASMRSHGVVHNDNQTISSLSQYDCSGSRRSPHYLTTCCADCEAWDISAGDCLALRSASSLANLSWRNSLLTSRPSGCLVPAGNCHL